MQKWEYTSIFWDGPKIYVGGELVANQKNANILPYIQQLGNEGWEMVTAVSEAVSICVGGSAWSSEKWSGIRWYFKRPKP